MTTPTALVSLLDAFAGVALVASYVSHRRNRAVPVELGRVITVRWVAGQSSRRNP